MEHKKVLTGSVLTLSLFHFFNHIYALALPPLFPVLKQEFGIGNAEVGLIVSFLSLSMILFQLPFGIYSDKIGRKKILLLCLSLMIISILLTSFSPVFWLILAFQFLLGIGASGYHSVGISAAADMSSEGIVGKKMSVQAIGGSLGVAVAPVAIGGLASLLG